LLNQCASTEERTHYYLCKEAVMHTRIVTITGILVFNLLFAAVASAAVVTSWGYTYNAGFTDWKMSDRWTRPSKWGKTWIDGEKAYKNLYWGDNWNGWSGISLDSGTSGIVHTNGDAAHAMSMTHSNSPTYGGSLVSGTVKAMLELRALDPYHGSEIALSTALEFAFYETPNNGLLTDDVFILTNPGVTTEGFEYGGEWYTLDFGSSYGVIPESYIEALGLDTSITYYGWLTPENADTTVDTSFTITHRPQPTPAPEPATLGLMGLGLVALGVYSRMKRNVAKRS